MELMMNVSCSKLEASPPDWQHDRQLEAKPEVGLVTHDHPSMEWSPFSLEIFLTSSHFESLLTMILVRLSHNPHLRRSKDHENIAT